MNIEKIYKPIKPIQDKEPILLPIYDPDEVEELEEKYKELLLLLYSYYKGVNLLDWETELEIILKQHTGKTWGELNEYRI